MQHNLISLFSRNKAVSKILSCCAVFMFVLLLCSPCIFAAASGALPLPMPSVPLPVDYYNTAGLEPNYEVLSDEQQDIANELMGTYVGVYAGLGLYKLANPLSPSGVSARQQLREWGRTFINAFFETTYANSRALGNVVGAVTQKASTYDSYSEYETETSSGNAYYVEYDPELTIQFRDWYFNRGGLYNWQFNTKPFSSDVAWTQLYNTPSDVLVNQYQNESANLDSPLVRTISNGSIYNLKSSSSAFCIYTNLFINTQDNKISLIDDNGNVIDRINIKTVYYYYSWGSYNVQTNTFTVAPYSWSYDPNSYSTYKDIVLALYNFELTNNNSSFTQKWFFEDFVKHVYVGANWAQRQEIFNIDDLNIADTTSNYIDNVGDTAFVDATGVIDDLNEGETELQDVIVDNTLVKDGDGASQLTASLLKAVDKYLTEPVSSVFVDPDVFSPLFGENSDGYIWYLWSMTKPLILYTKDFLHTLLFNGKGIAWIVYGVVSVGLIGGLVVKFLL